MFWFVEWIAIVGSGVGIAVACWMALNGHDDPWEAWQDFKDWWYRDEA
jgi:hypothetical protein